MMWEDYVYNKNKNEIRIAKKGDQNDSNVIYLGRFLNCEELMTILKYVRDVIYMMYEEIQKIKHLREVTFVMVEESSNGIECTKNRFGNRTMECCKNIEFEKIELSKIDNDIPKIRKEYYARKLWVTF